MKLICNHKWEYCITLNGMVDYGGPILSGIHRKERCCHCGKVRMKLERFQKGRLIISRKQNVRHCQLQLL
jgi:hypothetical protein